MADPRGSPLGNIDVIPTSYDVIISRCRFERKHLWIYPTNIVGIAFMLAKLWRGSAIRPLSPSVPELQNKFGGEGRGRGSDGDKIIQTSNILMSKLSLTSTIVRILKQKLQFRTHSVCNLMDICREDLSHFKGQLERFTQDHLTK